MKCVRDFGFTVFKNNDDLTFKEDYIAFDTPLKGVIDFGPEDALQTESNILGAFQNKIVHFQLQDKTENSVHNLPSIISFNGVNPENVIHGEQGLAWKTSQEGSYWKFNLDEGRYGDIKGKKWNDERSNVGGEIHSTAYLYLQISFSDFGNL